MAESITLTDGTTGATAKIMAVARVSTATATAGGGGRPGRVLWTAPDFVAGGGKGSHSGTPILFPFPGRLRGDGFSFGGRRFSLTPGDGIGNAIHGFVIDTPWRVLDLTATRAVAEYQASVDKPGLLEHWPADFRIAVAYELVGQCARVRCAHRNPGDGTLPFGFGTHAYFRVPLGMGGRG